MQAAASNEGPPQRANCPTWLHDGGNLGADFDASPLRLAVNETGATLETQLGRPLSFRRPVRLRFGDWVDTATSAVEGGLNDYDITNQE